MSIFYCWALVPCGCVILYAHAQPGHAYCTAKLGIYIMLNLVTWQSRTHKTMQFTLRKFIKTLREIIFCLKYYIGSSPMCLRAALSHLFVSNHNFRNKEFQVWVEIVWKFCFLWKSNRIGNLVHISKSLGTVFNNLSWSLSLGI